MDFYDVANAIARMRPAFDPLPFSGLTEAETEIARRLLGPIGAAELRLIADSVDHICALDRSAKL